MNQKKHRAVKSISAIDFNIKKNYKAKRKLERIKVIFNQPPETYKVWDHNVRKGLHDIHVRIFSPPNANPINTIVFIHGGGWATGNIDSYRPVCVDLAKYTNHNILAIDYRLAPEHKFPAGVEDCYFVIESLYKGYFQGIIPSKAIIMGDSAGGNITAAVSLMGRDRKTFKPEGQVLIYPSTYYDHSPDSPFKSIKENGYDYLLTSKMIEDYMSLYRDSLDDNNNPYFAPLSETDLSNQPNTLIITAQLDPLRDEGQYYGVKLKEAGNIVDTYNMDDALHGFFSFPYANPKVQKAYELINNFIDKNEGL